MDQLCIHSTIVTISVLDVHLLLPFCRGHSRLIGSPQPVVAKVGDDVILPCHLEPAVDVATKTLEWTRSDLKPRFVYLWYAGQDYDDMKNPSYKGRTSLFTDELKRGNISLKLSNVKLADEGKYRCYIPDRNEESVIELVVGSVSSPGIRLAGLDKSTNGVVLQCESKGWYPEPEVLWLDGEGNVLSAGPTETVRGPDDLYTVSSRVTVDKRHGNRFTCRVQQNNINQTRETHIHFLDDFFKVQSRSSATTVGLAVSLAVSIMLSVLLLLLLWKKNMSKRNQMDEVEPEDQNNDNAETELLTEDSQNETKQMGRHQAAASRSSSSLLQDENQSGKKREDNLQKELEDKEKKWENQLHDEKQRGKKTEDALKKELEDKNKKVSDEKNELGEEEKKQQKDLVNNNTQLEEPTSSERTSAARMSRIRA
ncbi:butyrophilin subfamily 3 member A2-like [Channa argus]|uniref:butyrophilin subfamily 3 member A2-like n=1 Tax=Channa argus TaxID=215402 RepID=UPI00351FA6B0